MKKFDYSAVPRCSKFIAIAMIAIVSCIVVVQTSDRFDATDKRRLKNADQKLREVIKTNPSVFDHLYKE